MIMMIFDLFCFPFQKDMGVGVVAKNFIPFGGGSRLCAGAEFTKVLMTTFFHVLVTNYR